MSKQIKEMAAEERPYEKCLMYGAGVLTDAELLAIIIRTGIKGENSVELSRRILESSGTVKGILGLQHLTVAELMKVKGIGRVKAVQLACLAELSKRMARAKLKERTIFSSPEDIAGYFMEEMRHKEQEELYVLMMNGKNRLLHYTPLFKGTVNASLVSPREIFIEAMKHQAVTIALLHNHPSGDPAPSREDILITRRIRDTGELVGIPLIDHVIIGDTKYVSMKERGIL